MHVKHLIIIMGVSGCGKTTIDKHIAENTSFKYMESDQFHSQENKRHMQSGRPLTDDMRWPWINDICAAIENEPHDIVLANSGLKRFHRARFLELDRVCNFIHLHVPQAIIQTRMDARVNHFMPTSLLDSQFSDMEPALPNEPIFNIDAQGSLSEVTAASLARVEDILRLKQIKKL